MKFNYITPPVNFLQAPFRVASTIIVRLIAPTRITPNAVTLARALVVMLALWFMARGHEGDFLLGALLFYFFEVLDHVDGDLARFTNRRSKLGPLLEQFQDTLFARPSNLLGAAVAVGLYRISESLLPLILFSGCVYGRMNWLEFRDYFGWQRNLTQPDAGYQAVLGLGSVRKSAVALAKILYIWNNSFILLPVLAFDLLPKTWAVSFLTAGFICTALLNNLPWIAIVTKGFLRATSAPADTAI
jgi:hypothetical protein